MLTNRRSRLFFKSIDVIKEIHGPSSIHQDMVITKEEYELKLITFKTTLAEQFDGLTTFSRKEIRMRLSNMVVKFFEIGSIVPEKHIELSEFQSEMFVFIVKEEVTMGPNMDLIKAWIDTALENIANTS
jgi:hypothetical protein